MKPTKFLHFFQSSLRIARYNSEEIAISHLKTLYVNDKSDEKRKLRRFTTMFNPDVNEQPTAPDEQESASYPAPAPPTTPATPATPARRTSGGSRTGTAIVLTL